MLRIIKLLPGRQDMQIIHPIGVALIALAALATAPTIQAAGPDLLTRELCREVLPQVATAFAGVFAPVRRSGHCIAGDFNGDGKPDVLMVVKVLVDQVPPAAGLNILYPFFNHQRGKGRLQFLASHAPADGTTEWARYDRLLLDGGSPIMVLRYPDMASDMARITRRSPEVKALQLPPRALRGDAVHLGTEAVDAILYWDGKTYRFHEDPSGP